MIDAAQLSDFFQIVMVDLTLAGDNTVVIGMAARGLSPADQRRAIAAGIAIATLMRLGLALVAMRLLAILGLTLAGGILLLWVAWKMFRELLASAAAPDSSQTAQRRTFRQALFQIVLADLSMSLDNVLAVAGTARGHLWILIAGLVLSIGLTGFASALVAQVLSRAPWVSWIGLAIVLYVSLDMIHAGWTEVHFIPH